MIVACPILAVDVYKVLNIKLGDPSVYLFVDMGIMDAEKDPPTIELHPATVRLDNLNLICLWS
jgi:hypothetical protein